MDVSSIARQNSQATPTTEAPAKASSSGSTDSQTASAAPAASSTAKSFVSPVVQIDGQTGAAVLSFRNTETGSQEFQIPSRTALQYDIQQRWKEAANPHGKDVTA